ncbi:MAG: D-alanyl-D-alanine carboxypeptidase [Clostridia bacterium]|nr:D-alanyl-D-alanine carboxypeptidase [Clostridia bacterium]
MKKYLYKSFIIFIILLSIGTLSFADDIEEETVDVNAQIKESMNSGEKIPKVNSRSCVVLDRNSNMILYGKNEKNQVKMASTTKIMTAIVVIENTSLDKTVEVSKKAAGTGGSRLGLKTGDKITIRDLLYGLMLCSGNDAAVCLAESVAGSVSEFSNLMNAKAQELGLLNSHFESPHGLDSNGHYTTAYELALLSNYALKNQTFLAIVGTKNYTVTINGYPKNLSNTNELLGNLNGVYGIKTGFTNGANRCLVTACKRGDLDIICVVLGADTKNFRTKDSIKLIEYSFKTYEYFNLKDFVNDYVSDWQNQNSDYFFIEKGFSNHLEIKVDSSLQDNPIIPIKKDLISSVEINLSINSTMQSPVNEGDLLGKLKVFSQGTDIAEFDVFSNTMVRKNNMFDYMLNFFKWYPNQLENSVF